LIPPGAVIPDALLQRHRRRHRAAAGERRAGQTVNFAIFSDGSPDGDAAASALLQTAEPDYTAVQEWFKAIQPPNLPFYVYTDPSAGGAFHITCAGTDVHVSADPVRAPGFLVAEIVEVFEAAQAAGWDCARTNGEALSRVLAFERHPEIAPDFMATEQDWWGQGHADYVNDNSAGDRDQLANGCGDLFLYYLHSQLTFSWNDVVAAGGQTLGAAYQALTGYDSRQGFNDFVNVLALIDRGGGLDLPASGNPFPIKT
jgi:hypothetical protein